MPVTPVSSMEVLNPRLYRALSTAFGGHVRVENHGERRRVVHLPDWRRGGRPTASPISNGEYYCVNCYHCYDTKRRLYVNHEWGQRDPVSGDNNLHLVHCFNEACMKSKARQKGLLSRVYPLGMSRIARTSPNALAEVVEPPVASPKLPEGIHPINQTVFTYEAAAYLQNRGFDLDYLWNEYQVHYADYPTSASPYFTRRIVIPVYTLQPNLGWGPPTKQLFGWQARCIGEPRSDEPKYLSARGMRKSKTLYGLPQAVASTGPLVIVEGPTDVWRLGSNAVALFGKDMSMGQRQLIERYFPGRPIVVFLDRDARDKAVQIRRELRSANLATNRPVVIAEHPPGRDDVDDCTFQEAWHQVQAVVG